MRGIVALAASLAFASPGAAEPPSPASGQIAAARTEAHLALAQTDLLTLRRHLQRAVNCLVGSDAGSYLGTVGSACESGASGILGANPTPERRAAFDATVNALEVACGQGDLSHTVPLARQAVAKLDAFR